jgi:hypothetical protein
MPARRRDGVGVGSVELRRQYEQPEVSPRFLPLCIMQELLGEVRVAR